MVYFAQQITDMGPISASQVDPIEHSILLYVFQMSFYREHVSVTLLFNLYIPSITPFISP